MSNHEPKNLRHQLRSTLLQQHFSFSTVCSMVININCTNRIDLRALQKEHTAVQQVERLERTFGSTVHQLYLSETELYDVHSVLSSSL